MAEYIKQEWEDAIVDEQGHVIKAGTVIDKAHMEHIEDGVSALNDSLSEITFSTINIYVATTGSDTTGDGTLGKPYATFQKAFSKIPTILYKNYTINIADGTYEYGNLGKAFIYYGGGLYFNGKSKENTILVGNLFISTTAEVYLDKINFQHGKTTDAQVNLQKCRIKATDCIFDGIDKTQPWNFMVAEHSTTVIRNCTFKNASAGIVCGGLGSIINLEGGNIFENCNVAINSSYAITQITRPQIYTNCITKFTYSQGGLIIDENGGTIGVV